MTVEEAAGLQVELTSADILTNAAEAYRMYEEWMALLVQRQPGFFRMTVFGSHHLEDGHPHIEKAHWFGSQLGAANIDIIEGSGGEDSVMGQVALGHAAGCAEAGTTARCIGNSIKLPWESGDSVSARARHRVVSHTAIPPRLDVFGGLASDFLALEGGVGTFNEIGDVWQRVQFALKIQRDLIPQGLRLSSNSARLGWHPTIFCYGDESVWGWLRMAIDSFASRGRVSVERGEHKIVQIMDDHQKLMDTILERRVQWRAFVSEHGVEPQN